MPDDEGDLRPGPISNTLGDANAQVPTSVKPTVARNRSSIGSKLLLAFIVLQLLALLVALLTSLSLQKISESQNELSSRTLPTLIRLEEVLGKTSRVVEATRNLSRVEKVAELDELEGAIQRDLATIENALKEEQAVGGNLRPAMQELEEGFESLNASSASLSQVVRKRLSVEMQRDLAWSQARQRISDILLLIEPLSEALTARSGEAFMRGEAFAGPNSRREELNALRLLTESEAKCAKFWATLLRIGLRLDQAKIAQSVSVLRGLERGHALDMRTLALLLSEPCFAPVRPEIAQHVMKLGQLETSDSSVFFLQGASLKQRTLEKELEARTSQLRGLITAKVDLVTGTASRRSRDGISRSDQAIGLASVILWGTLILSVLIASAFMWLYVKRRILDRLLALNVSMSALLDGHLEKMIPIDGDDELALMGASLEQFRVNEIRLQTTTAGLRRRNEELSEFAHAASHDLRSPLRAVDNLASWLSEDCEKILPPDSKMHLATIRGRISRMEGLLNGLLSYYRAGTRKGDLETQTLKEVVHGAVENVHVPSGFEVTESVESGRVTTWVSPLQLVLRNLIDNAIKHHDQDRGKVSVSARIDGTMAIFVVSDDGPGIPAAMRQRVFRIFATLKPRDEIENSGVGLSLVKKTVEHVGGSVTLASAPEGGCQFIVRWPASSHL